MSFSMKKLALAALLFPGLALAKTDAAKERAEIVSDFTQMAAKVDAQRKAGQLMGASCTDAAEDFIKFGKKKKLPEAAFNGGVLYENCGDTARAQDAYREALKIDANFAPAQVNLGEAYYRAGNMDGAQQAFEAALRVDAKNVQAYNDLALVLVDQALKTTDPATRKAAFEKAVGQLRRALAVDADSMPAYSLLALVYYTIAESDRSKLDLAALVCDQAKKVNDSYAPIYNTLGLIDLRRKNVTSALQEFRKAAELEPRYVEAQLNIGAITLSARDYASAEQAFKAALDAQPTDKQQLFQATMGMGVALRGLDKFDDAEQWYTKAKEVDPQACAVSYNLGVLYQDYKQASDNSNLNKAKGYFNEFTACGQGGKASSAKLADATRRIKDVDDYFTALAEAKKMEEEAEALQKQAEAQQKAYEAQQAAQQKAVEPVSNEQKAPPPATGTTPEEK